jgi:hypothetical protein
MSYASATEEWLLRISQRIVEGPIRTMMHKGREANESSEVLDLEPPIESRDAREKGRGRVQ